MKYFLLHINPQVAIKIRKSQGLPVFQEEQFYNCVLVFCLHSSSVMSYCIIHYCNIIVLVGFYGLGLDQGMIRRIITKALCKPGRHSRNNL